MRVRATQTSEDIKFARRHRREQAKRRGRGAWSIVGLRIRDLEAHYRDRYGEQLPADDAGRDSVLIAAHHLAHYATGSAWDRIHAWAASWAPWMQRDELDAMIDRVLAKPIRWRADTLGKRLGLTDAERTRLQITTIGSIDVTAEERAERRLEAKRLASQAQRRAAGVSPRPARTETLAHRAPWCALGISERTWHRRQARGSAARAA